MKKKTKNYKKQREFIKQWLKAGMYAGGFCETCGGRLILFFKHDAVCCPGCNQWIDLRCGDPECPYCSQLPADAGRCSGRGAQQTGFYADSRSEGVLYPAV